MEISLREQILLDKLKADLRIEEAKLSAVKSKFPYILETILTNQSENVINEIKIMIYEIESKYEL